MTIWMLHPSTYDKTSCRIYHSVTSNYNYFCLQLLILYFKCTIVWEFFFCIFNMCNVGSTSIFLQLLPLLLMRITMRGNHMLVTGSLERHCQWRRIIRAWINWRQILCVGYLMVTTDHSENLSSFHYILNISDEIHLLLDTNQRG